MGTIEIRRGQDWSTPRNVIGTMEKHACSDAVVPQGPLDFSVPRPASGPEVGQAVRIKSGQLSGLEGVIVKTTADGQCVVELSQLGPGVLATLHCRQLTRT